MLVFYSDTILQNDSIEGKTKQKTKRGGGMQASRPRHTSKTPPKAEQPETLKLFPDCFLAFVMLFGEDTGDARVGEDDHITRRTRGGA
jgi:hypothetical protein